MSKKLKDKALEFYNGFDSEFLKELETIAQAVGIPAQTLMSNMLMKASAFQYSWLNVFGSQCPGFLSEIRFDKKGDVITGPQLLKELTDEAIDHLTDMKKKLERISKTGKAEVISKQAMSIFQECSI